MKSGRKFFENDVLLFSVFDYDYEKIYETLNCQLFDDIKSEDIVVLKPNWIKENNDKKGENWISVITHPSVITAVLKIVIERLNGNGKIIIADAPETATSFEKLLEHYPIKWWREICESNGIVLEILDLRDEEWIVADDVIVNKVKLEGDPKGSTIVNLFSKNSCFFDKNGIKKKYFGAESNIAETNIAHDGLNNLYKVSRSIIEADIFINLPKLKTHKKAGITASLKNLVGINTYKNYLPHNTIGIFRNGDQYSHLNLKSIIEGLILPIFHQVIFRFMFLSHLSKLIIKIGKFIFGSNASTIRSGSWYGNDTIWRMVLDLNKVLFYANSYGELKEDSFLSKKKYITIIDGIIAGEGEGPKSPEAKKMNYLFAGKNPVAVDSVCAKLMSFDPLKIPTISNAFNILNYSIVNFELDKIKVYYENESFDYKNIPSELIIQFEPSKGWKGFIEIE